MKIYTSYFGQLKKLGEANITPIGIARYPAKFYHGMSMFELAPRSEMLNMSEIQYDTEFKKILSRLDAQKIFDKINALTGGKDAALLCFERPDDPCHRHMVGEWLQEKLGIEVTEFAKKQKPQVVQQPLLF